MPPKKGSMKLRDSTNTCPSKTGINESTINLSKTFSSNYTTNASTNKTIIGMDSDLSSNILIENESVLSQNSDVSIKRVLESKTFMEVVKNNDPNDLSVLFPRGSLNDVTLKKMKRKPNISSSDSNISLSKTLDETNDNSTKNGLSKKCHVNATFEQQSSNDSISNPGLSDGEKSELSISGRKTKIAARCVSVNLKSVLTDETSVSVDEKDTTRKTRKSIGRRKVSVQFGFDSAVPSPSQSLEKTYINDGSSLGRKSDGTDNFKTPSSINISRRKINIKIQNASIPFDDSSLSPKPRTSEQSSIRNTDAVTNNVKPVRKSQRLSKTSLGINDSSTLDSSSSKNVSNEGVLTRRGRKRNRNGDTIDKSQMSVGSEIKDSTKCLPPKRNVSVEFGFDPSSLLCNTEMLQNTETISCTHTAPLPIMNKNVSVCLKFDSTIKADSDKHEDTVAVNKESEQSVNNVCEPSNQMDIEENEMITKNSCTGGILPANKPINLDATYNISLEDGKLVHELNSTYCVTSKGVQEVKSNSGNDELLTNITSKCEDKKVLISDLRCTPRESSHLLLHSTPVTGTLLKDETDSSISLSRPMPIIEDIGSIASPGIGNHDKLRLSEIVTAHTAAFVKDDTKQTEKAHINSNGAQASSPKENISAGFKLSMDVGNVFPKGSIHSESPVRGDSPHVSNFEDSLKTKSSKINDLSDGIYSNNGIYCSDASKNEKSSSKDVSHDIEVSSTTQVDNCNKPFETESSEICSTSSLKDSEYGLELKHSGSSENKISVTNSARNVREPTDTIIGPKELSDLKLSENNGESLISGQNLTKCSNNSSEDIILRNSDDSVTDLTKNNANSSYCTAKNKSLGVNQESQVNSEGNLGILVVDENSSPNPSKPEVISNNYKSNDYTSGLVISSTKMAKTNNDVNERSNTAVISQNELEKIVDDIVSTEKKGNEVVCNAQGSESNDTKVGDSEPAVSSCDEPPSEKITDVCKQNDDESCKNISSERRLADRAIKLSNEAIVFDSGVSSKISTSNVKITPVSDSNDTGKCNNEKVEMHSTVSLEIPMSRSEKASNINKCSTDELIESNSLSNNVISKSSELLHACEFSNEGSAINSNVSSKTVFPEDKTSSCDGECREGRKTITSKKVKTSEEIDSSQCNDSLRANDIPLLSQTEVISKNNTQNKQEENGADNPKASKSIIFIQTEMNDKNDNESQKNSSAAKGPNSLGTPKTRSLKRKSSANSKSVALSPIGQEQGNIAKRRKSVTFATTARLKCDSHSGEISLNASPINDKNDCSVNPSEATDFDMSMTEAISVIPNDSDDTTKQRKNCHSTLLEETIIKVPDKVLSENKENHNNNPVFACPELPIHKLRNSKSGNQTGEKSGRNSKGGVSLNNKSNRPVQNKVIDKTIHELSYDTFSDVSEIPMDKTIIQKKLIYHSTPKYPFLEKKTNDLSSRRSVRLQNNRKDQSIQVSKSIFGSSSEAMSALTVKKGTNDLSTSYSYQSKAPIQKRKSSLEAIVSSKILRREEGGSSSQSRSQTVSNNGRSGSIFGRGYSSSDGNKASNEESSSFSMMRPAKIVSTLMNKSSPAELSSEQEYKKVLFRDFSSHIERSSSVTDQNSPDISSSKNYSASDLSTRSSSNLSNLRRKNSPSSSINIIANKSSVTNLDYSEDNAIKSPKRLIPESPSTLSECTTICSPNISFLTIPRKTRIAKRPLKTLKPDEYDFQNDPRFMLDDKPYVPPKVKFSERWVSPKLLTFCCNKLKPYGLEGPAIAERVIAQLCATVKACKVLNNPQDVDLQTMILKSVLVKFEICTNVIEYCTFILNFTPFDFQRKVLPMGGYFNSFKRESDTTKKLKDPIIDDVLGLL